MKTRTIDNTEALKRIADKAKEIKQEKEGVTMTTEKETATNGNSSSEIIRNQIRILEQINQELLAKAPINRELYHSIRENALAIQTLVINCPSLLQLPEKKADSQVRIENQPTKHPSGDSSGKIYSSSNPGMNNPQEGNSL